MKLTWKSFRTDRLYLTKYFLLHALVLSGIAYALHFRFTGFHLNLSPLYLALLPFAIIAGIKIPVLMHNCMHANLKGHLANEICGELSGFFALMSLSILRINHTFHHAYADTEDDPHDPAHKSFLKYLFVSQLTGAKIIENKYLQYHGRSLSSRMIFKLNIFLHYSSHFIRLWIWFLVLGPEVFTAFYIPAFTVYSLAFAHVNYITHTRDKQGNTIIVNKNENLYYKFVNFIGSGVYFHKNHHQHPKLINPMVVKEARAS